MDLEAMFDAFRHICDRLEAEEMPLEDRIALYAQGVAMSEKIKEELAKADRRVVQVISQDGTISDFGVVGERK